MNSESCHNGNFVGNGDAGVVVMTTSGAASNGKIGIMTTLEFQRHEKHKS